MTPQRYLVSVDIGSRNFAIGFALLHDQYEEGPLHILRLSKIDLKMTRNATQEQIAVTLMRTLHEQLNEVIIDDTIPMLLVIEKQVPKAKRNISLAMTTLTTICTWSLVKGREHDMYQFMTALNKFHPTTVPYHLKEFKTFSKNLVSEILEETFYYEDVNLREMIFDEHKNKADDLCDCLLQLRSIQLQIRQRKFIDTLRHMDNPFPTRAKKEKEAPAAPAPASRPRKRQRATSSAPTTKKMARADPSCYEDVST